MTETFDRCSGGQYLTLIRLSDPAESYAAAKVLCLRAKDACDEEVNACICGDSWRERLVGQVLAVARNRETFVPALVQSLVKVSGFAIIPGCAAIVVLLEKAKSPAPDFSGIDLTQFSGEVGWAINKVRFYLDKSSSDPGGFGPADDQSFEDHLKFLRSIRDTMMEQIA